MNVDLKKVDDIRQMDAQLCKKEMESIQGMVNYLNVPLQPTDTGGRIIEGTAKE